MPSRKGNRASRRRNDRRERKKQVCHNYLRADRQVCSPKEGAAVPEGPRTSHDAAMRCSAEWRGESLRCGCRSHCRDGELVCRCDTCTSVLGNSCDYEYGRANRETTRCSVCWCTARFRDGDRTCWCDACTGGCMHPNLPGEPFTRVAPHHRSDGSGGCRRSGRVELTALIMAEPAPVTCTPVLHAVCFDEAPSPAPASVIGCEVVNQRDLSGLRQES